MTPYRNKRFPGVSYYFDRHGKMRWRYRVRGFAAELGRDYASEEFLKRYHEAVAENKARGIIPKGLDA